MLSAYQKSKVGVGNVPLPRTQLECLALRLALPSKAVGESDILVQLRGDCFLYKLREIMNMLHVVCMYTCSSACVCVCTHDCVQIVILFLSCSKVESRSYPVSFSLTHSDLPTDPAAFLSCSTWSLSASITSPATQGTLSLP